jgi:hypothetical protein
LLFEGFLKKNKIIDEEGQEDETKGFFVPIFFNNSYYDPLN